MCGLGFVDVAVDCPVEVLEWLMGRFADLCGFLGSGDHISFRRREKHGAQSQPSPFPPITAPRGIPQGKFPRNPQRPINQAKTTSPLHLQFYTHGL